jgi:hypothetical protein
MTTRDDKIEEEAREDWVDERVQWLRENKDEVLKTYDCYICRRIAMGEKPRGWHEHLLNESSNYRNEWDDNRLDIAEEIPKEPIDELEEDVTDEIMAVRSAKSKIITDPYREGERELEDKLNELTGKEKALLWVIARIKVIVNDRT